MLVLTRRKQQALRIKTPEGRTIDILVVAADNGKSRLGITADKDVEIDRLEVALLKEESRRAS